MHGHLVVVMLVVMTVPIVSMMMKMLAMRLIRLMQCTRCSSLELSGSEAPPCQVFSQCSHCYCIALHAYHILFYKVFSQCSHCSIALRCNALPAYIAYLQSAAHCLHKSHITTPSQWPIGLLGTAITK